MLSAKYEGRAASVPAARRFVRDMLAGSPRLNDLELITAELATNAIQHSRSALDGGIFTVTVMALPGAARIQVMDEGSGWVAAGVPADLQGDGGRGLQIVSALADKSGHDLTIGRLRIAWAEVTWLQPSMLSAELRRNAISADLVPGDHRLTSLGKLNWTDSVATATCSVSMRPSPDSAVTISATTSGGADAPAASPIVLAPASQPRLISSTRSTR